MDPITLGLLIVSALAITGLRAETQEISRQITQTAVESAFHTPIIHLTPTHIAAIAAAVWYIHHQKK